MMTTNGRPMGRPLATERPAMSTHLVKLALVVVLTQGYRALGSKVGPRWAGLAAGLPCTSAVALIGGGCDRGVEYAVTMAGASLIGLVGAAALPLAYARATLAGWSMAGIVAVSIISFLGVTALAGVVVPASPGASAAFSGLAVLAAATLAGKVVEPPDGRRVATAIRSPALTWAIRTLAPLACLGGTLAAGAWIGPGGAGLMGSFPAVTLTIVALTHLESGPGAAIRMARAFPPGNLGMVAFLAAFRLAAGGVGLMGATGLGYFAALVTLATVSRLQRREVAATASPGRRPDVLFLVQIPRPRAVRRFKPRFERLAA